MNGVLVDTCVWVGHFRQGSAELITLLGQDRVVSHPLVIGEIACGAPPSRARTLADLASLPMVRQASIEETVEFVDREGLYGKGCGLIDLQLLASTLISTDVKLWTADKRLGELARRYGALHAQNR